MTLSDLRTRIYYRVGRGQEASNGTIDTDILYALNNVQRELMDSINFQQLQTSTTISAVASTQAYNLPANFGKMRQIWNNDTYDRELTRIYPNEYKQYLADVDTTEGTIYYYDIYDTATSGSDQVKKIHFFPVPSANTTVPYNYYQRLDDLSSDTDENILTELYPNVFIEGAAYMIYRDVIYRDQPEKIAFRRQEYDRQVEVVKKANRQPDSISKVQTKRVLPGASKLFTTQYTGYTS